MVIKNIHKNERIFRCLILINSINGRSVLDSADKSNKNGEDKRKNILCEIFYVVSVCMSGEILEDRKVRQYGPDINQVTYVLFVW